MSAALWPAVVDGLVAVYAAAVPSVPVFDGMPLTHRYLPEGVAVGITVEDDDGTAGEFSQEWRDAGPAPFAHRTETGSVRCSVWVQTGDQNAVATCRRRAWDILSDLLDASAPITPIGVDELTSLVPLTGASVIQAQTNEGTFVSLTFTVAYSGLVT